jgi:hypothetical protein
MCGVASYNRAALQLAPLPKRQSPPLAGRVPAVSVSPAGCNFECPAVRSCRIGSLESSVAMGQYPFRRCGLPYIRTANVGTRMTRTSLVPKRSAATHTTGPPFHNSPAAAPAGESATTLGRGPPDATAPVAALAPARSEAPKPRVSVWVWTGGVSWTWPPWPANWRAGAASRPAGPPLGAPG